MSEKRDGIILELQRAKESAERELTKNILKKVLEKNLKTLEDEIKEELSKPLRVKWAEVSGHRIRIFSNSGHLIHAIYNDKLTEEHKLDSPVGISVDKQNNIVVAHKNKKCRLIAF